MKKIAFVLSLLLVTSNASAEDWPQWRGPGGQGHASTTGLPLKWSETQNVTWKTPLPGKGHSSPVITGNQVWLTAAIDTPETPERTKERLAANTGNQPLALAAKVDYFALCVDKVTGKLLHNVKLFTKAEPQWVHSLNSYASPTPVIDDGHLVCHFGSSGTASMNLSTRKVVWLSQANEVTHENGPGSTPVVFGDRVITTFDGSDQQFIIGLDKKTGKTAWKTKRTGKFTSSNPQLQKSYGTPLIVDMGGRPVLVSPSADWLYGYNPETGKEMWRLEYGVLGFSIVPRPVTGHGMIFMSTSFMKSELLAIRYEKDGQPVKPSIVWRHKRGVGKMPSPILVGDHVYTISDKGGIITCLNAHTGAVAWQERMGGNFSSSPTFADGHLFFHSQEGKTLVIKPGPKYVRVASNELNGKIMASAAAVDGAFFIRTDKGLYRIEKQ